MTSPARPAGGTVAGLPIVTTPRRVTASHATGRSSSHPEATATGSPNLLAIQHREAVGGRAIEGAAVAVVAAGSAWVGVAEEVLDLV